MARTLALCALLGVVGIVSAGYGSNSYSNTGNTGTSNGTNCAAKKYMVEGMVSDPFLTPTDANGKNGGFIIEFLELLKSSSGGWFDYQLTARPGGSYGVLVDDLVNKKFDVVAADFTVTSDRQAVIDFLQPYLRTQVKIVVNSAANAYNGLANPTWYIEDDVSVKNLLQVSSNATLNAIYQSASAGNRTVVRADGFAALLASNSPAAFVVTTPGASIAVQNNAGLTLLPDILETAFYALAIQSNQNALRLCLNNIQLKAQETGQLQALRNKYNFN